MTILLIVTLIAWLLTSWILDNQIQMLEYENRRLRNKIREYEKEQRTRIR